MGNEWSLNQSSLTDLDLPESFHCTETDRPLSERTQGYVKAPLQPYTYSPVRSRGASNCAPVACLQGKGGWSAKAELSASFSPAGR